MDKSKSKTPQPGKVVDLLHYRKHRNEERRREYERVLFNRVLGVYSFIEAARLQHIEVIDISYSGIRFRDERPEQTFQPGHKLGVRFYLTPSTFLRLPVEIKRVHPYNEDGRTKLEYGCVIDKETKSYEVIKGLVSFMHKYAEYATQDASPPLIWF